MKRERGLMRTATVRSSLCDEVITAAARDLKFQISNFKGDFKDPGTKETELLTIVMHFDLAPLTREGFWCRKDRG